MQFVNFQREPNVHFSSLRKDLPQARDEVRIPIGRDVWLRRLPVRGRGGGRWRRMRRFLLGELQPPRKRHEGGVRPIDGASREHFHDLGKRLAGLARDFLGNAPKALNPIVGHAPNVSDSGGMVN